MELDATLSAEVFVDVLDVSDEGVGKLRTFFGKMTTITTMPNGQVVTTELEPDSGDVRIIDAQGNAQPGPKVPQWLAKVLTEGFTIEVDQRGKVRKIEGLGKLQAAFEKMGGAQAGTSSLTQMVRWLEPLLPEEAVEVGDEWEDRANWFIGLGVSSSGAKELVTKYVYQGVAEVDGCKCAKIEAAMRVSGLDLSVPAELTQTGLETEIKGMSLDVHMTYYLSLEDGHVQRAKGRVLQTGTVHVKGTVQVEGEEMGVDQSVQYDGLVTEVELVLQK